jgi:uroporphyrinogen-III synthase
MPRATQRPASAQKENAILHQIIETISYNLDLDEILDEIIQTVDQVAHADEIFLYLLKGSELTLRAAKRERPEEYASVRLKLGQGITGWAAKKRQTVRIAERAYQDKRFHAFSNLKADRYEAFLSMPMLYHNKLIGVLNVQHRRTHHFTAREVQLMQTIAAATAGAIENARLFELTAVLNEELAARKVVEQAKGKLMRQYTMTEDAAYRWLKKRAMDLRKSMKEVAEAVLISIE